MIGRALGHYQISEKSYAGRMGDVCHTNHSNLQQVPSKALPIEFMHETEHLSRIKRQARL
jgi:hypothetical protein